MKIYWKTESIHNTNNYVVHYSAGKYRGSNAHLVVEVI